MSVVDFCGSTFAGDYQWLPLARAAFESPSSCSNHPHCIQTAQVIFIVLDLVTLVIAVAAMLGHSHPVDVMYGLFMGCMWAICVVDGS